MQRIAADVTELVGNTPLMRLSRYESRHGIEACLIGKVESMNPGGSAKDRVGLALIEDARSKGLLPPGGVIVEPTSGNTGVGLAMVAAAQGYRVILTMPETMSIERRRLLAAYGAELVLTDGVRGMQGAIEKAQEILREIPGSFMPGQFENPANPQAHYRTTGPEIWRDTDGMIDIFVAGVGTGGTLSGTGRYLKEQNPVIQVVGVEPASSAVLSGGKPGPHQLQGIGAGFVPKNFDPQICDEIIPVSDADALAAGRELAACEGLLVGVTSGAAVFAAAQLARREENRGKRIVAFLPDTGERYLSGPMFE